MNISLTLQCKGLVI